MTGVEVLLAARNRIWCEYRWTQFARARDVNNAPCDPGAPYAEKWSLDGAVWRSAGDDADARLEALLALKRCHRSLLLFFNDSHNHAQCIDLIDRAVATLRVAA